jgi:hypothetical protein
MDKQNQQDSELEQLMSKAWHWLITPEIQKKITGREIGFIASVHLQYRQGKKISIKQKQYVTAILLRHTK